MVLSVKPSLNVVGSVRYTRVYSFPIWRGVDYYDAQYNLSIMWIYKLRRTRSSTTGEIYIRLLTTPAYTSAYYYGGFNLSIRARELKCTGKQYYCYNGWNYNSIAIHIDAPTNVECEFFLRCKSRDGAIELYLEDMAVPTQLSSLI